MSQIELAAVYVLGFIGAFIVYAATGLRHVSLAFVFWFPFPSIPVGLLLLMMPECMRSAPPGPGAPLAGAASGMVFIVLLIGLMLIFAAMKTRPTRPDSYRWQIMVPTIIAYFALYSMAIFKIKNA